MRDRSGARKLLIAVLAVPAIGFGAWHLGRQSGIDLKAHENVASRDDLEEIRAQLEQQRRELRGTQYQVTRLHDLGAGAAPAPPQEPAAAPAPASARSLEERAPQTREEQERFFATYFSEMGAELEVHGRDVTRTADVGAAAEKVVAENKLGRIEEVTCSDKLCRIVVAGTPEEPRGLFAEVFNARMAQHFGAATLYSPGGGDRLIGYFAKVEETLRPPTQQQ